jgi:outer membrane biosynthesis protein TonB
MTALARFAVMGPRALVWRRSRFGTNAERVARALLIAGPIYLFILLIGVLLSPLRPPVEETVVELPDREVVLIEEPKLEALPPADIVAEMPLEQVAVRQVADPPQPEGIVNEPLPTPLREREPAPDPDKGREGRRRAEAATAQLAGATAALDGALGNLSSALRDAKSGTPSPSNRRRARRVGGGRDESALAGYDAGAPATGSADLAGSGVAGSVVAIGTLAPAPSDGGDALQSNESRSGMAPGVYRSNASLMSVIQRYAAGIQFCYENELNRQPGLRGKLVVALSVAASGEVVEATVVQNTLGSSRIASCALSQIRQWKFPAISGGVTNFQTPFVFTPPQ